MKAIVFALAIFSAISCSAEQWRLVFEGDSITQGVGVSDPTNNRFSTLMTSIWWRCSSIDRLINVGASSSRIATCDNRYTNSVFPHRPAGGTNALLCFAVGVNNLAFQDPSTNTLEIIAQYSNYCRRAKADGFKVAAFTTTSNSGHGIPGKRMQLEFIAHLRTNYYTFADYLIDAESILPNVANLEHFGDGLHWTNGGHSRIAEHIDYVIGQCGLKRGARIGVGKVGGE